MKEIRIFAFSDEGAEKLDDQILALKRNRLAGTELRTVDGIGVQSITHAQAKEIGKRLSDQGLSVWSVGSPIGKIDLYGDHPAHRDAFRYLLETAVILGAARMRMFSYYIPKGVSPADCRGRVMDELGILCELAEGSGVILCHENEKGIYGDTAERCRHILEAYPQIRAVFDPANFVQCGQDTWEAWQMLHPFVDYMHIKDALADGSVVPAGMGIGNVRKIVAEYLKNGGTAFTIEPHLKVFSGMQTLERAEDPDGIGKFCYPDNASAFDAACSAFSDLLASVM